MPDNPDWQPRAWDADTAFRMDGPISRLLVMVLSMSVALLIAYVAYRNLTGNVSPSDTLQNATTVVRGEASVANEVGSEQNK